MTDTRAPAPAPWNISLKVDGINDLTFQSAPGCQQTGFSTHLHHLLRDLRGRWNITQP